MELKFKTPTEKFAHVWDFVDNLKKNSYEKFIGLKNMKTKEKLVKKAKKEIDKA